MSELCVGEIASYMRYVRSLEFTQKPDYNYLRTLFHDVLRKNGWDCDWEFDWIVQQKVSRILEIDELACSVF